MKACWAALLLAILIGVAIIIIGTIGFNSSVNEKKLIQLQNQNQKLDFLLQEERDKVEELEEKLSASFTLEIEIR